jgi:threonine dehydratase
MSFADVQSALFRIQDYARRTPILEVEVNGRPLVLKLEHLQMGGSFKLRGALNAMLSTPEANHFVTASGGNHGIGVATAARLLGRHATVFVPDSTPHAKATRIESQGAELVRRGSTYEEADRSAREFALKSGAELLHAHDDARVIAGQGTLAIEILEAKPQVDVIVVAAGGGGLAAGCVLGGQGRKVLIVEPENCCCVHQALIARQPIESPAASIAESALGATRVGELPFAVFSETPPLSCVVSESEIIEARDKLWEDYRLAVEPAAAVGFAALVAKRVPGRLPSIVICGANTSWMPT